MIISTVHSEHSERRELLPMRMLMDICNADVTAAHHFVLIPLQSLYHHTCSDLTLLSLEGLGTVHV